jgi:hypothetical protein
LACACSCNCRLDQSCATSAFCRLSLEFHPPCGGLVGGELRLRLRDRGFLRGDLVRRTRDRRFLSRDLLARGIDRQPIIAVVDGGDHVAGMNVGIVDDRRARDVAGDLGGKRRVVGLHVSVISGDQKAADRHIAIAEPAAGAGGGKHDRHEYKLAAGTLRAWQSGRRA